MACGVQDGEKARVMKFYKLEGRKAVPCSDYSEWGQWFETANRIVAKTVIEDAEVSTVFLGIDHGFGGSILLYETMVFGTDDEFCYRYSSWEDAEIGHKKTCSIVKKKLGITEIITA